MKTKTEEKKSVTHIITDVESMSFTQKHDLWFTECNGEVLDFYAYDEFVDYVAKIVTSYLDAGYAVVAVEEAFKIVFTFIKGKSKKSITFMMSDAIHLPEK